MDEGFEIDIFKLLAILWQRILAIILASLIGAAAALSYSLFFVEPKYKASASFYVNNSSVTIGSASFTVSDFEINKSAQLVDSYLFILNSRTTLEDVASKSGLNYSYSAIARMLTSEPVENTAAFTISVTSTDPIEAELIANTIAEVLPDRISEIIDGSSVRIVDYAIVPAHSSSPNYTRNTLIGFVAGAFLSAAVVTVLFLINEKNFVVISTADELREEYPDISLLALIPDMRYTGKKNYYYYSSYYGESDTGSK